MSREEEVKNVNKYNARYVDLEDYMLVDISVTLARICDSLERIAGYLESPYSVTNTAIVKGKETE